MGKTIIMQARGHGSKTYQVRARAFVYPARYLCDLEGEYEVIKLVNSSGFTAPLAKLKGKNGIFFDFAANGIYEGQKIRFGGNNDGDIARLGDLPTTTKVLILN